MVADVNVKANVIEVTNFLKKLSKKQKRTIQKSLNRVSNMAVLMITKRTQKGLKPDGGRFIQYSEAYKQSKDFKKKKNKFVDLTLSGKMFRSLDFKKRGLRNTLFFANKEREKIAFRHDTGVGKLPPRPFFAIGRTEEEKIVQEFNRFYFKEMRL